MKNYPKAYIDFLIEFHCTRDFFECHEIMEEYWKEHNENHWLGLIQLAVAIYHERQKNYSGSLRLYEKSLNHLKESETAFRQLGLDVKTLSDMTRQRILNIKNGGGYKTMNLPISDNQLVALCKEKCAQIQLTWCDNDNQSDESLVYRHKLRDRSDVIEERLKSLDKKK
ncbi:DUF309 domain-containing protein [Evansella cellulosilytica]|uniref:DUF309 domain-containing protein n=1 Tax=Evansella cellulosilytica (strain ATCC 21833 / DSM 2522 / FERM P-1141 / JCM 9156 / N-4) TaxID=649639 RepID=E6TYM0_EVAC2|nr:DUF309 domain-containing protein [Evansella cellulosilytica]ADU30070.1 protein of unknown function DUF309 [Evansella cellulosilytica DSM 2522]